MSVSIIKRIVTAYVTMGRTFNTWISFIFTGFLLLNLRISVSFFMLLDYIFFPSLSTKKIKSPIIIVGNPRSGTTFLHRYLIKNKFGNGSELWQLIYTSITMQKLIRPLLPILNKFSPTKHHSTDAHKTSLTSIETDDASMLFRFFDGFFMYGFILSWNKEELFDWIDPKVRDMSKRDYDWFESMWKRTLIYHDSDRMVGKLFSVSANAPTFINKFKDAKIIYLVRDPLSVIPSGLSLVTGVLDKKFGFWSMPQDKRQKFINRLYFALKELLLRFEDDWTNERINKKNVLIVKFDDIMNDFETVMKNIVEFTKVEETDALLANIKDTALAQKSYKSNHKYDLNKFGLTEDKIRNDCKPIYDTFLN